MNININSQGIREKIEARTARTAIVGFGYIGAILGAIIAESGFYVLGIDIDAAHLDRLKSDDMDVNEAGLEEMLKAQLAAGRLELMTDFSQLSQSDIIIVSVSTPVGSDYNADLGSFKNALERMSPYVRNDQLVIIKSTVPPLTTEHLAFNTLYKDRFAPSEVLYAFCPERIALGNAIAEFRSIPVIVGGINPQSNQCVADFFKASLGVESVETSLPRTAEMVKLADNLWIDLNIAMANELAMLSDSLGIDVLEIIRASNTLAKGAGTVNILLPGVGVGGSCLPKDPHFLVEFGKTMGLDLQTPRISRSVNDQMPAYSAGRIEAALKKQGGSLQGAKVAILGIAYKNNTGDCRKSPAGPFVRALVDKGADVSIYDPNVGSEDAVALTGLQPAANVVEALDGAACIAFLAGHEGFRQIRPEQLASSAVPGALVFDGRMYFDRAFIDELESRGLNYMGVGR